MNLWSEYVLSQSVDEALQALTTAAGPARLVAGGTDLLIDMQQGRAAPVHTLVDVSRIPELLALEVRGSDLFIGAGVPVSRVAESPVVRTHALALAEACALIGGPQVRNCATLGGNVAHALPAADGTIALLALDARAEIAGLAGRRSQPILEIFTGLGKTALTGAAELLVGFSIPLRRSGQASAFSRVMRPQGVALPVLNLAIGLERAGACIRAARIAVGPAGATPQRAWALEQALAGQPFSQETLQQAQALVQTNLQFRSSPARATAAYRYHLCQVLLAEVLQRAWQETYLPVEE
jgi:xanthine dehydrogenase FAD-binding subunit